MPQKSKVYLVSDEEFKQIVQNADSYSDCLRALKLGTSGGSSTDILKRRINELSCDISHFGTKAKKCAPNVKYELEEILVENSSYANISRLKERLIKEHKLEYKCAKCGIIEWLGQPISLQLHHKNGINNDHRIENLEFLCPNCHSQTDTYCGKNKEVIEEKKKHFYCPECGAEVTKNGIKCINCANKARQTVARPDRETLKQLIRTKPFTQIALDYQVSDNAIRKWCIAENLPNKVTEIKKYSDEEWSKI